MQFAAVIVGKLGRTEHVDLIRSVKMQSYRCEYLCLDNLM